jgi:hypothetical protein
MNILSPTHPRVELATKRWMVLPCNVMHYRLFIMVRHIGDVRNGKFTTHLREADNLVAFFNNWKDRPVTIGDREEPMDWNDPIKVWYKLIGNLQKETHMRARPVDPPPPGLPPDAPGFDIYVDGKPDD